MPLTIEELTKASIERLRVAAAKLDAQFLAANPVTPPTREQIENIFSLWGGNFHASDLGPKAVHEAEELLKDFDALEVYEAAVKMMTWAAPWETPDVHKLIGEMRQNRFRKGVIK